MQEKLNEGGMMIMNFPEFITTYDIVRSAQHSIHQSLMIYTHILEHSSDQIMCMCTTCTRIYYTNI